MNRGLSFIMLVGVLATGCSSSEDVPSNPASPTPLPPVAAPASPPPAANPSCKPAAPTNLTVTTVFSTRTLTWNAVGNAVEYVVLIGRQPGVADLISTNTTHTNYTWTGAPQGTYYARVYANNSCGSGASSAEVVFN